MRAEASVQCGIRCAIRRLRPTHRWRATTQVDRAVIERVDRPDPALRNSEVCGSSAIGS